MLPEPTFSFTIPSIHDNVPLDCRIYHPTCFLRKENTEGTWRKRGVILAHPYAPLGGSYDDPVVASIAVEILKNGFVIGVFNFRGAGDSKGRTSWTGKPEMLDYVSFAGFFVHYLNTIQPNLPSTPSDSYSGGSEMVLSPIESSRPLAANAFAPAASKTLLILGGYSYGSLITKHLPSTGSIIERFNEVIKGTAEAEIRLRALNLGTQWNGETHQAHLTRRGRSLMVHDSVRSPSYSVIMGGEESDPGVRRASRESRRSVDMIRKSFDTSRKKITLKTRRSSSDFDTLTSPVSPQAEEKLAASRSPPMLQTCHLLVSPLLPPISMFATFFNKPVYSWSGTAALAETFTDDKLALHPTLAIYGDKDMFTSHKKSRKWAEGLMDRPESLFRFHEVAGAGHFWHEEGVEEQMRKMVRDWVAGLIDA